MNGPLERIGLARPEHRAWASYDWANSAFATSIMGALLPIYYVTVSTAGLPAATGTVYWGYTSGLALAFVAITSPFLGAAADRMGARKKLLASFASLGALGCFLLFFSREGDWLFASAAFVLANIGYASGNVFYESLLPHVASSSEANRVSTAGYALGYVGGGLLLALHLAMVTWPASFGLANAAEASRWAFLSVAVWWLVFTVPILVGVPEPPSSSEPGRHVVRGAARRVFDTLRDLRSRRQLFLFLLAFWFYNDGINTIIKMATAFGTEIGIGMTHLMGAYLMVQLLGVPATFAYGGLADRIGVKRALYAALVAYTAVSGFGYFVTEAWHFWVLAAVLGLFQGGSQAISRSLFASMVPKHKSSELFGFYSVSGKFGNIIGPVVFALVADLTGSSRYAIVALAAFFLIGMTLLSLVDLEEGQRVAAAESAE